MISIVTVTFNNFEELLETCKSIEGLEVEHIVVNGGGCVKTKEFLFTQTNIKSISEKDRGIADAFSKGVRLATTEYVCFINSGDTLIDREYFKNVQGYLNISYDVLCCDNLHIVEGVGKVYKKSVLKLPNMPYNHQGLIIRKKLIEDTGYFDESFKISMDYDSVLKIWSKYKDLKVYYYEKPVVLMDGSGVSHTKNYIGEIEKYRSLKKNDLLSFKFSLQLFYQFLKAQLKRILILLRMNIIVNKYKQITQRKS